MIARPMQTLCTALAAALAAGGAQAASCALDQVPAATLLVPYFEVDLAGCSAGGRTTTVWVRNVGETHQLAQLTMWGDYGVPVAGFHIYLPPHAAEHIDLADVLCRGIVPSTGRAVSPVSEFGPPANVNFPGCNNTPDPANGTPVANMFTPAFLADVQARLTGLRSPQTGVCYGSRDEDPALAHGYITIDVVNQCGLAMHYDPGFLQTALAFDNVLVGGFEYIDPTQNFAQGAPAVAIEAAPPGQFVPGDFTFYGRLAAFTAVDRREPLPSSWAVPISQGGATSRHTDLVVWRETPRVNLGGSSCNVPPSPMPLPDSGQTVFDDTGESAPPPVVFPGQVPPQDDFIAFGTQRVQADELETSSGGFSTSFVSGTAHLNLQYFSPQGAPPRPYGQSWVGGRFYAEGRYSDFAVATALDSMCTAGTASPANVAGPLAVNPNTRFFIFSNGLEP